MKYIMLTYGEINKKQEKKIVSTINYNDFSLYK